MNKEANKSDSVTVVLSQETGHVLADCYQRLVEEYLKHLSQATQLNGNFSKLKGLLQSSEVEEHNKKIALIILAVTKGN